MRPVASLLDGLGRSKLLINRARPNGGVGERRSASKGAGLEFVDHRAYQAGDDTRHIDVNLHARHGVHYIRQYSVDRQLRVTILVDASLSMGMGSPDKFAFATTLANTFGFVGLAGGDLVTMGVVQGRDVHWSPSFQGLARVDALFDWMDGQSCKGTEPFARSLRRILPTLRGGLVILISDWWTDDVPRALKCLDAFSGEALALQVLSPEEDDPRQLGQGPMRLLDVESGEELELVVNPDTVTAYGAELLRFRAQLDGELRRRRGRFFPVRTDADLVELFGRKLRASEVVG